MKEGQAVLKLGQYGFYGASDGQVGSRADHWRIITQHYLFTGRAPGNLSSFQPYLSDYNVLSVEKIYIMDVVN